VVENIPYGRKLFPSSLDQHRTPYGGTRLHSTILRRGMASKRAN